VIAGSFGHGTIAGAGLCRGESFVKDPLVASGGPFECPFSTEVVADEALPAKIVGGTTISNEPQRESVYTDVKTWLNSQRTAHT
jgi:hypothetical protein